VVGVPGDASVTHVAVCVTKRAGRVEARVVHRGSEAECRDRVPRVSSDPAVRFFVITIETWEGRMPPGTLKLEVEA
jgi:hypothetical protein